MGKSKKAFSWLNVSLFVLSILAAQAKIYQRKDLVFVIDSSKSIKQDVYETSIEFISSLVDYMSISPGTTRVALITFSSKAKLEFNFEQCVNRECVQRKFASIFKRTRKGRTNIEKALKESISLFKHHKGFAKDREIYLLSDGKWNEGKDPTNCLKTLRKLGIKIRVFAIGRAPKQDNLKYLTATSCKDCYLRLSADVVEQTKIIKALTGRKEPVTACKGRGIVLDECKRECDCIDGEMKNCFRIRKEFTTLPNEEKKRYLQAYYKITTEEPLKTRFIPFISKHAKWFWKGIHEKKQFFPWHRWFIYWFENLLREADCRVTLPFWDWSYWSENPWKIGLHIWRDDELGLGGNGVKEKDYCVQSGPFNASVWAHPAPEKITSVLQSVDNLNGICYTREYGGKHKPCLRRSFSHLPANLAVVLDTISIPCSHFEKFDKSVREDFHNDIHNEIGGEMSSDYAANTPEFFLHHAFLDNIWYRWQEKDAKCKYAYYGKGAWDLIDSSFETSDFIDSFDQGDSVKVKYDDFLLRVMKPGDDTGKPRKATIPQDECPYDDADSNDSVPRSAFRLLKDQMRREREQEEQNNV